MIPTTHITIIWPSPPPDDHDLMMAQKLARARLTGFLRGLESSGAYVEIDEDSDEDISGAVK